MLAPKKTRLQLFFDKLFRKDKPKITLKLYVDDPKKPIKYINGKLCNIPKYEKPLQERIIRDDLPIDNKLMFNDSRFFKT